ncbi:MAG TPA: hypothetical protein VLC09_04450 [Polyangiaceae bacterium]|nr:hypothetical protein [Polyangiaceae bacterium]
MTDAFSAEELELVAIDMGYGHLRPAHALSTFLGGQPVLLADRAPLANEREQKLWRQVRGGYEVLSRAGRLPLVGGALGDLLNGLTAIPQLYPRRDLSKPNVAVRALGSVADRGLGAGLAERLRRTGHPLLTTFYGPAVLSDYHGAGRLFCVVTDADVNRVWAPIDPRRTEVVYLAPSLRVRRRLKAYGVPSDRVIVTGYPLPHELLGGPEVPVLRENLRRRLPALDPRGRFLREVRAEVSYFLGDVPESAGQPLHLTFAVGGAGAQVDMAFRFLPSLARRIRRGKLRLTLVAGIRPEVAARFHEAIAAASLVPEYEAGGIRVLLEATHDDYFAAFNRTLAETDVLWTKPSELTFFGALGIPLIFSKPVGAHERYNRRWAIDGGSGIKQYDPEHAGDWLWEMLKDGTLAGAAWTGYGRMPKFGLYRIVEEVLGSEALARHLARAGAEEPPQGADRFRIFGPGIEAHA